jgi:hypothetical protein
MGGRYDSLDDASFWRIEVKILPRFDQKMTGPDAVGQDFCPPESKC